MMTQLIAQVLNGQISADLLDSTTTKISVALALRLALFTAKLFRGEFDHPETLALALDELSDLAWAEAEQT